MKARPVRRSDGREYPSASEAARGLIAEQGCGKVPTMAAGIANVANGRPMCLRAYGYGWEWIDEQGGNG